MLTIIMSNYANLLALLPYDHELRARLDRKVLSLIVSGVDASEVPGAWWERIGDQKDDPSEALDIYKLGVKHAPLWYTMWIKALGSAKLTGASHDWVFDQLDRLYDAYPTDSPIIRVINRSHGSQLKASHPQHIKDRWNAGKQLIKEIWHDSPKVREAIRQLPEYPACASNWTMVKDALVTAISDTRLQGKSRDIARIMEEMHKHLGYNFKETDYDGFGNAEALAWYAASEGITKLFDVQGGTRIAPGWGTTHNSLYLPDEELPIQECTVTLPIRHF